MFIVFVVFKEIVQKNLINWIKEEEKKHIFPPQLMESLLSQIRASNKSRLS